MQYFIALIDYGKGRGLEAIVNPEDTRADIVQLARMILREGSGLRLEHVKSVDGNFIEDITEDILIEAEQPLEAPAIDLRAFAFDHAHDIRKHGVM